MSFTNIKVTSKSEHQKVWDLLPWYVNHSLDTAEQDVVKNHVRTCITCRIELNQQQQVFEKIQQTDFLQQVSQVSFAQLKKRIEEQPKLCALAKHNKPKKELKFFSHQFPGFVKYTALAASLLLLATPFMLNSPIDKPELKGEYRTLANSTEGKQKNNIVRIVFADQPGPEQIEAILNSVSGHIVKRPSKNGVYEVQIGNQQTNSQEVNDAISHLRKNKLVIFVELAQGLPYSD
jgi:hypothetical protein